MVCSRFLCVRTAVKGAALRLRLSMSIPLEPDLGTKYTKTPKRYTGGIHMSKNWVQSIPKLKICIPHRKWEYIHRPVEDNRQPLRLTQIFFKGYSPCRNFFCCINTYIAEMPRLVSISRYVGFSFWVTYYKSVFAAIIVNP